MGADGTPKRNHPEIEGLLIVQHATTQSNYRPWRGCPALAAPQQQRSPVHVQNRYCSSRRIPGRVHPIVFYAAGFPE
jgi:hypothetical protein